MPFVCSSLMQRADCLCLDRAPHATCRAMNSGHARTGKSVMARGFLRTLIQTHINIVASIWHGNKESRMSAWSSSSSSPAQSPGVAEGRHVWTIGTTLRTRAHRHRLGTKRRLGAKSASLNAPCIAMQLDADAVCSIRPEVLQKACPVR